MGGPPKRKDTPLATMFGPPQPGWRAAASKEFALINIVTHKTRRNINMTDQNRFEMLTALNSVQLCDIAKSYGIDLIGKSNFHLATEIMLAENRFNFERV